MNDGQAIEKLKSGNIQGLESLVKNYQLKAIRAAFLIVQDPDMAEDIVEDAFLRAYDRIKQFDSERAFGPWFYQIVINLARRAASKQKRTISLTFGLEKKEVQLADKSPGPEKEVEQNELHATLWHAIGKLSPKQRAIIIQRYFFNFSLKEIAQNHKLPIGTVKWQLHMARKKLGISLQSQNSTPTLEKVN